MQKEIQIRPATPEDANYIADHLRKGDFIELSIAQSDTPGEAVRKSLTHSNWANCVLVDGVPAILYGVSPSDDPDYGIPWMLGTDGIYDIKHEFVIGCRAEVEKMLAQYRFLYNQVHCENAPSIRWLRWLGFTVDTRSLTGPLNEFYLFWIGEPKCVTP